MFIKILRTLGNKVKMFFSQINLRGTFDMIIVSKYLQTIRR